MRLITFNIHGWRTHDGHPNLDGVVHLLRALHPDVVALNEVFYPRVVAGSRQPALTALAQALNMHYVFGPCLRWPAQDNMPADAYGNALLSRWPIIASAAHHLTPKEEDQQGLLQKKEQRGLLEARLHLPDQRTFTVYVTHLDHTQEAARSLQLRVARTWLQRDRNRPHAVVGDFNALSRWDVDSDPTAFAAISQHPSGAHLAGGTEELQVIAQMEKSGYVDCFRQHGQPQQRTFLPEEAPLRIDYIFASATLAPAVRQCTICADADGVSDHRPVMADLEL